MRHSSTVALVLSLSTALTPAQSQPRWDPTRQVWFITIHDDANVPRAVRIEPANRVVATATLVQIDWGTSVAYRYSVGAAAGSPQSLAFVSLPCKAFAAVHARTGAKRAFTEEWGTELHCTFEVDDRAGGGSVPVTMSESLLAGLGAGIAVGSREFPSWPTNEPTEEIDSIRPMVDSLLGLSPNGLVARFPIGVPKYERARVAQTDSGLSILRAELQAICRDTKWIPDPRVCAELRTRIPSGTSAGQIRQGLDAFIAALIARRNTSVHQNAFTILHVLARAVRAPLIPPE